MRELWRHRERRGAYTRIYGHWATQLRLNGLRDEADALEADCRGTAPSPERVLIETFDFMEICCGPRSPLCEAMARQGLLVGPTSTLPRTKCGTSRRSVSSSGSCSWQSTSGCGGGTRGSLAQTSRSPGTPWCALMPSHGASSQKPRAASTQLHACSGGFAHSGVGACALWQPRP